MLSSAPKRIFVYDALASWGKLHWVLKDCVLSTDNGVEAYVRGTLYDLGELPGLYVSEGRADSESWVRGELWTLTSEKSGLEYLDLAQGCRDEAPGQSFLTRRQVTYKYFAAAALAATRAWCYVLHRPVLNVPTVPAELTFEQYRKQRRS